uniref:Gnk2-homologous domain-containing protein n=1 Tax=Leersia perrieri TaxID=77586 RepID=A0A0D9WZV2_9ORYZ
MAPPPPHLLFSTYYGVSLFVSASLLASNERHGHVSLPPRGHHRGLAATLLISPLVPGQPLGKFCGDSAGNYTRNDTYQSNLARLSTTLTKNASSSATLFATATLGAVPDIVYALALCRGDTTNASASACAACVAATFQDAQQLCPYNKDATVFYDPCAIRFSTPELHRLNNQR